MHIAVIGNAPNGSFETLRQAAHASMQISFVPWVELRARVGKQAGVDTDLKLRPDACLVRGMPRGSLEQVIFQMNLLARWEASGVPVFNSPRALEIAIDKYLSLALIRQAGLAVPETVVTQNVDDALRAFHSLGGDVVIKPVFGGEGRGLVRVTELEIARRCCQAIVNVGGVVFLQQFIECQNSDMRLLLIGDQVFAMHRSNPLDWRANATRGAQCEAFHPSEALITMAKSAMQAVGCDMAGVDLISDRQGNIFVLEVNGVPGWKAIEGACQVDVSKCLLEYIKKTVISHE